MLLLRVARPRVCTALTRTFNSSTQSARRLQSSYSNALVHAGKPVALWLTGCASIVAGVVCIGGLTRLTRSGLSMTDWRPHGGPPPSNTDEWEHEFSKYKASPEFSKINQGMTLDEFKFIYYMEWGHRMLGRTAGMAFSLPLLYFCFRGRIQAPLWRRMGLMLGLGGCQGLIGWWMVRSGLKKDTLVHPEDPRVSPYRLAVHLSMAFTLYALLTWTAADIFAALKPELYMAKNALRNNVKLLGSLHARTLACTVLVGSTALSGAFVAGNDAGRAFNDWPQYAEQWVPEGIVDLKPFWRNAFENTAMVQFNHRNLAYGTLLCVGSVLLAARAPAMWSALPTVSRAGVTALAAGVATQASLGVTALMNYVPVWLGSVHQVGALTVWTIALGLLHSLRVVQLRNGALALLPMISLIPEEDECYVSPSD